MKPFRQEPAIANALYLGASSGSLAAVAAALGIDTEKVMEHTLRFAQDSRECRLGPVDGANPAAGGTAGTGGYLPDRTRACE